MPGVRLSIYEELMSVSIPVIEATAESLQGYSELIHNPEERKVETVRWPANGRYRQRR